MSKAVDKTNWRLRSALHLVTQLPDDPTDALRVLDYAREIVEKIIMPGDVQPARRLAAVDGGLDFIHRLDGAERSIVALIEPHERHARHLSDYLLRDFVPDVVHALFIIVVGGRFEAYLRREGLLRRFHAALAISSSQNAEPFGRAW
jgi:hypothetical protein